MPDNLTNWGPSMGARDLILPHGFFIHFLLTLFRVGGIFAFIPVPGLKSALDPTRIGLVVLLSGLVFPLTPSGLAVPATISGALALTVSEVSLGLVFGLSIQFLHEGVLIGSQILSVQAGYSYASTIDPTSDADSSVLQVILVLGASLFFLTLGLDRILLKAVVASFDAYPPGAFVAQASTASSVISISGELFSQLRFGAIRILDDIVQDGRCDDIVFHPAMPLQNQCDRKRMHDVRDRGRLAML